MFPVSILLVLHKFKECLRLSLMFLHFSQYVPSSFGQPQNNVSASSQFQPTSQVHAPVAPVAGQPWLSSGNQSVSLAIPIQQTGQQPPLISSADTVSASSLRYQV